jgi:hypothetical protein
MDKQIINWMHIGESIAMGAAGTDVAIETLMNDDLSRVVNFMDMTRKVMLRIKLNIFFSIMYNIVGFILAGFGMLTPVLAVIFQEAGCITVVFSSTLLLWSKTGSRLKNEDTGDLSVMALTVENVRQAMFPSVHNNYRIRFNSDLF